MMSTECTTLESSTPSQPYSSSKMFTCDHQSSVINSSYASTNTLIKNFPFPTFTPSATASASTNPLSSLNSTITTSAFLPVTPSSTLSSAKDNKLSNGEISQEKDINSGNFQLTPEDSYPSECKSSIYLSNQQINSCKYTLPIREAIISPNPFMNKMNITDVMKSHHSLRSVTTTKRAKDHQSIYHKFNKHCTGCNQPIFEKLYLGLSDGQLWHMNCLICHTCGKCLDKEISCFNRYGQIYCRKDYEQLFGSIKPTPVCTHCKQLINPNELVLKSINQLLFHSECFSCNICHRILKCGDRYELNIINNQPICWEHCHRNLHHHHHQHTNQSFQPFPHHVWSPLTTTHNNSNNEQIISSTHEYEDENNLKVNTHQHEISFKGINNQSLCSTNENNHAKLFNVGQVTSNRNIEQDVEELPKNATFQMELHENNNNKSNFVESSMEKQKAVVSSIADKQEYKSETSKINPYFIPLVNKNNSLIDSPSNDSFFIQTNKSSNVPFHYLPPLLRHSSPNNLPFIPFNPMCKLENNPLGMGLPMPSSPLCPSYPCSLTSSSTTLSTFPSTTASLSFTSGGIPHFTNNTTATATETTSLLLPPPPIPLSTPSSSLSLSPPSSTSGVRFATKHFDISPLNYSSLLSSNHSSSIIDFIDSKNSLSHGNPTDSTSLLIQQVQQKRNRKRRNGINQVFDNDCFNGSGNFCLGITARQKRMRTSFKHHQLRTMKAYFNMNHNPDVKDLKVLTEKTGLSKRVLQVWFQNARAKYRRNLVRQETPTSINSSGNNNNNNGNNNNHTNSKTNNNLMSSSNGGSSSEMLVNSISECDSQSSHINQDEYTTTVSQTTPSSTSPHKNDLTQDDDDDGVVDDDDEDEVEYEDDGGGGYENDGDGDDDDDDMGYDAENVKQADDDEDGNNNNNNITDNEGRNNESKENDKYECLHNDNPYRKNDEQSNNKFDLFNCRDNQCHFQYPHCQRLTEQTDKLFTHKGQLQRQQQQQQITDFPPCITSMNSSTLSPAFTDHMVIPQHSNNSNANNTSCNIPTYGLLQTNKIFLENEHQLTTNLINYPGELNNFLLPNKCPTVNRFPLTGIH